MGESSACLLRSFSMSPSTSSEKKKGETTLQRALTTSVSFGRFASDSLDWERWSAFTHNRHLEEVERYSKPGSVAEKKAYFEAHFKRRRAAALLEQQNSAANNDPSETNTENKVDDNPSSVLDPVIENTKGEEVQIHVPVFPVGLNDSHDAMIEKVIESPVVTKSPVELSTKHLENDNEHKDNSTKRNSESISEKEPKVSPKCVPPVKPIMPSQIKNVVNHTPNSKKIDKDSSNKRRSYITSLHTSINFASSSQKPATSPGLVKNIANPRLVRAPAKKYKNSTVPQTSTRASVTRFSHNPAAPPVENKRMVTPQGDLNAVRRTVDWKKVHSQSSDSSKSLITSEGKTRVPTTSSPYTFKSEERAAKRKEFFQKLEQKTKSKETEKHELLAKTQVPKEKRVLQSFRKLEQKSKSKEAEKHELLAKTQVPKEKRVLQSFRKLEQKSKSEEAEKHELLAKTQVPKEKSVLQSFRKLEQKSKSKETEKHELLAKTQVPKEKSVLQSFRKLELKSKSKETEKHELLAKSEVTKSRGNFKDLRTSVVTKSTEKTEVPSRTKLPSSSMKKIPTERQRFPKKIEEKENNSRPPWSVSAKTEGLKKDVSGKNRHPSEKRFTKKTNENASPNIRT